MKKIILISCTLLALVTACKKKATTIDPHYEGYWAEKYNEGFCNFYIEINKTSHAKYETPSFLSDCRRVRSREGYARVGNGKLVIGLQVFKIEIPPTIIDTTVVGYEGGSTAITGKSVMKMKLNGIYYYKIIGK
jgi:hypothetical protein